MGAGTGAGGSGRLSPARVAAGVGDGTVGPRDIAALRLAGVYDDRQEGLFMLRTRVPGGVLYAAQARVVAGIAQELGRKAPRPSGEPEAVWGAPDAVVEITTRQDLQLHWVGFESLPEIWQRYEACGLSTLAACGDTLRNVTACPLAGVSPYEVVDTRPLLEEIGALVTSRPELAAALPRKFKVAVSGCPTDCVVAGVNDLAFTPAYRDGVAGFNVSAGGGLGDYPRLASPLDLFVAPEGVVAVVCAVLEVYRAKSDPMAKAVNRFRMLVHQWGAERVAEAVRRRLPFDAPPAGDNIRSGRAEDHLGVHPQAGGGWTVGVCVPAGRLAATDLEGLAHLARDYGDGGLRLTQGQNVVLTGVRDPDVLLAEPLLQTFRPDPDPFERGLVACTGAPFCKFGVIDSKTTGLALAAHLRASVPRELWDRLEGLRLRVSGCKAACAQTHTGHVGLRGTVAHTDEDLVAGLDVAAGGDAAAGRLGRWAGWGVEVGEAFRAVALALGEAAADGGLSSLDEETMRRALDRSGGGAEVRDAS